MEDPELQREVASEVQYMGQRVKPMSLPSLCGVKLPSVSQHRMMGMLMSEFMSQGAQETL